MITVKKQHQNLLKYLTDFLPIDYHQQNKFYSKISSAISRARDLLSKHALRCLYFALVHSHLTYVIHVWGNSMTINKIITLQKRAIRTINKVWYRSHTEPLFKYNQILKFEDMHTMQISLDLSMILKLKFRQYPAIHTNYSWSNCTISN